MVAGDARGGTLGFPTANLAVPENLLVPAFGIYAGAAGDHRAAISIGVNPHYGGRERRVEAFLLDFADDLYGQRLIVEPGGTSGPNTHSAAKLESSTRSGDVEAARPPSARVRLQTGVGNGTRPQVRAHSRIYLGMEGWGGTRSSNVVTVQCLGCAERYPKPLGGGTVRANPGRPECGYAGWVLAPELPRGAAEPRRSYEGRPHRRSA